MNICYPAYFRLFVVGLFLCLFTLPSADLNAQFNFDQSDLDFNGNGNIFATTSLMFGPDGRLYVAEYTGTIKILTIQRNGPNDYEVTAVEPLNGVKDIQNYDDDGSFNADNLRETIGIAVTGTATNPVFYVSSSDFRVGGGPSAQDSGLDTNSGIITRFSWNGASWDVVDLVRGLPRSEENHATNGLEFAIVNGTDYLIVASGGITNAGSPSNNFSFTQEYALSGAILAINLSMLETMPILNSNGRDYVYDLPTLDDPTRANVGPTDPDAVGYTGVDVNDPFGGNDGLNQAMLVAGGPVQIFSPGYRNSYDLVVTESGAVYATDNGANGGWGGFPENEGTPNVTNNYIVGEPGSSSPSGGEQANNQDHLQLITTDIQNYSFGSYYGGHPNPTRANPNGAGIYYTPDPNGNAGAVFRTQIYDPDGSTEGSTMDPNIGLPANWAQVVPAANLVEGDWRGPGINNPDGPDDNPVTLWGTNTNGLDEYTASNFSGALQGNLIAGVNGGVLRRAALNPDGSLETLQTAFASNLGGNALGITCNSDNDPFPGTIWVGIFTGQAGDTNVVSKIVVIEPADPVNCINPGDLGYDANADYDNDGYTNQDEEDNGTDPCVGASQPNDFDKSAGAPLVSDLNDPDDDADGINDDLDPLQLGTPDAPGSDAFSYPVENELFSDTALGGYLGLGMTGLMNNGDPNPNWLNWLDRKDDPNDPNPNDILGGAIGGMTMQMTDGTALGNSNDQEKGFQYGVQVDQSLGSFTVSGRIVGFNAPLQLYGNGNTPNGELGIFIGDGTQSNYIKFVLTQSGLTAQQEIDDIPQASIDIPITIGSRPNSIVTFFFVVDATSGQVDLLYSFDTGNPQTLGTINASGSILTAIQNAGTDLVTGLIGTSNASGFELEGTWDFLNVLGSSPFVQLALEDISRLINEPDEDINLNDYFSDDFGDENLTYTVEANTNNTIGATITDNVLTLSYPSTPEVTDITIRATDEGTNFVEQTFTVTVTDTPVALFRVNTGGPAIAAIDGGIDWEQDTPANNSQYLAVPGSNNAFGFGMNSYTPEVNLTTTPTDIYETERADIAAGAPNMTYSFPVAQPGNYEMRLYMGNGWSGTANAGERIFSVSLEGLTYPLLKDIDLSGTYGHQVGTVLSHIVKVTDGSIDISFVHGLIENPFVNGIEILNASDANTPIYVDQILDQTSNIGEQLDGSLVVFAVGGDGNLGYSAQGLPPGLTIEPTNGQIGGTITAGAETNSPYAVSITVDDSDAGNTDAVTITFQWNVVNPTSYRINAGGEAVTATDNGPDWRFNAAPGAYTGGIYSVNTGLIVTSGLLNENRHSSVPAYVDETVFNQLFAQERYDTPSGQEMQFILPVENGDFAVNLYIGNAFTGTSQVGQRVFDIDIEGALVENDLDIISRFGDQVGGMLSYPVTVADGELNITFLHDIAENPLINAIEIFEIDNSNPSLTLDAIANQTNDVNDAVNLATNAAGGNPGENIGYYISGQPEGLSINPSTGVITGTIDQSAAVGGPDNNGVHVVVVTVTKPGSAPASQVFDWIISQAWINKDEDENYTARHENSFVQAGDKFYLMGGRENALTVDIYDYTSNSWTSLANSAPFEFNHFQATEYQGLIWLIGAFKDNNYPNEIPAEYIWAFDPANQEWIQGPQIPLGRRRGSSGLVVYNNKFYVVAGNTDGHDGGFVPWFDEYDPATGVWTPLADAPRARDHFAAAVIGDKLYAAGGRQSDFPDNVFNQTLSEVDVYDFTNNTWSTLPAGQNIPTPRGGASSVNYNDRLVVIGGETAAPGPSLTVTEEYDPVAQSWRNLASLNSPRHGTQAIVSGNGIFILAGSPLQGGGNQKNMEYFGEDNPVGDPSVASTLNAPAGVQILDGTTEDITLDIVDGNVGVFVTSMVLSGSNAADFVIQGGELTNQLLSANSAHAISVELTGAGPDRNAVLTINYGNNSSVDIILSNNNLPPNVTNPGDQFNNEGDVVSLQIEATDMTTDLAYAATGLPPDLIIDPATGLISGTIADGTLNTFLEENGLLIIEAESGTLDPSWAITTTGGATGIIAGTDHLNNQNGGAIPYRINITTPGVYRFNWRSFYSGISATDQNDNWLRFPNANGVWFFGYKGTPGSEAALIAELDGAQNNIVFPVGSGRETAGLPPNGTTPVGASGNGYFKIYRSNGSPEVYNWQALTNDNDGYNIYVRFENPGTYTMEVSERSAGHAIDKIALYKVDGQNYSDSELTNAPESQTSIGQGAAENSPYNVEITVTDDGTPPLDTQIQFVWIIGDGTNEPPTALAEAIPLSGDAPLDVGFIGSNSTDDLGIVSYLWDFKDGSPTSGEVDPIHTFANPGTYEVELTVTDVGGLTDTDTVTIVVNNPAGNEAPVAVAEATPEAGDAPLEVTFTGSNSTDDVGIVSYLWDFKDGATSTAADTEHTFSVAGDYLVELTVTDGEGLADTTTVLISVANPAGNNPPVAVAEATPLSGNAPLEVTFTGSNSTDDVGIVDYLWQFIEAGNISTEADPTYTFSAAGNYDVILTVTDGGGLTDTETLTITVGDPGGNQPPVSVPEATPESGNAPLEVTFTGSNSTDDVGVVGYLWDFMDGGNTSTEADPFYTFANPGNYDVTLTVTDGGGLEDVETITITVNDPTGNQPPVSLPEATPLAGDAPLEVTFTGSNSTDDVGVVAYLWEFMDGGNTSSDADPTYTFTTPGSYTVELTVTDDAGLTDTAAITITVTGSGNNPPTAVALASPTSGTAPLSVIFNGENSHGDNGIISYLWDFMDGNTSTDINPAYTFTADGTYNVQLTVTDSGGLTGTATVSVVVGSSSNMPPTAVIGAEPSSGNAPLNVIFTGRNSVDDFGVTTFVWDFGDGTTSTEVDPEHTYTEPGEYTVVLTVTDAGGLVGTATVTINVGGLSGDMMAILVENPSQNGIAKVQVLNKPTELIVMKIYLHDYSGRLISSFNAQQLFVTGGTYEVPVATLRDGLYFVGLEMSEGDPLLVKLLVKN